MFRVPITDEVVRYAERVLEGHNFGRRGEADGDAGQQLTGLVGEITIQDLFEYPRTKGTGGPDGGVDLVFHGLTIDVKTMRRDAPVRPNYVNNFSGLQAHSPSRVLVFCSLNWSNKMLTVCGWTLKDLFFRVADFYPKGTWRRRTNGTQFPTTADLYEIRNRDLYSPRTMQELCDGLRAIAISEGRCSCDYCLQESGEASKKKGLTALDLDVKMIELAGSLV